MGNYSIKELEKLSGIKAHTIRIWEKRHQIIKPRRTRTNIRYYSDDDLKRIINVSLLNAHGVKISKIVGLSTTEINQKILELTTSAQDADIYIEQLIVAMIDLEEAQFDKLLLTLTLKFGFERTVLEVVYPFLEKVGILWQTDSISPAQEHFISNLIRQKMLVAIDSLPMPPKDAPRVILFLPENEWHELGLLFYYFLAKKTGLKTYYLGQSVPYPSLKSVIAQHRPVLAITSLSTFASIPDFKDELRKLREDFPHLKVLGSGYALSRSRPTLPGHFEWFDNALRLKEILEKLL